LVSNVELVITYNSTQAYAKIADMNYAVVLLYQLKNVAFNAGIMAQ
jgi:hypothetical protein